DLRERVARGEPHLLVIGPFLARVGERRESSDVALGLVLRARELDGHHWLIGRRGRCLGERVGGGAPVVAKSSEPALEIMGVRRMRERRWRRWRPWSATAR